MVEYSPRLNFIFGSLADPTRRDILRRISHRDMSVGDIAARYETTFAAISKHIKILEQARLVKKHRKGKEQIVKLSPVALKEATGYLKSYEQIWNKRLDSLEVYLRSIS